MRRFHWPLERLLTVTAQRERALKARMLDLSRRMANVRQVIVHRQTLVRLSLRQLGAAPLAERMRAQEIVMSAAARQQRDIARGERALADLHGQRRAAGIEFVRARTKRQTLERMRGEALQQHVRAELALEQKRFDETAQISFGRKALQDGAVENLTGA
ncbi:MAG TPA: hypothetical protein VFJ30_02605 [Phycisphaerae bacterium]|nr:hypothetical protein [Phycisphaerae bacterium]